MFKELNTNKKELDSYIVFYISFIRRPPFTYDLFAILLASFNFFIQYCRIKSLLFVQFYCTSFCYDIFSHTTNVLCKNATGMLTETYVG